MLTFVESHHMEWLSKDSRLDECELACHAKTFILSIILSILAWTSTASRLLPSNLPERGFHRLGLHDSLQENCAIELLRVMRPIMGALPRLSVLPFFRYSSTLNFVTLDKMFTFGNSQASLHCSLLITFFIMLWIGVAKLNNIRASPAMQKYVRTCITRWRN